MSRLTRGVAALAVAGISVIGGSGIDWEDTPTQPEQPLRAAPATPVRVIVITNCDSEDDCTVPQGRAWQYDGTTDTAYAAI